MYLPTQLILRVCQIDVVFPSNRNLLEALQKLETFYQKGKVRLYDVLNDYVTGLEEEERFGKSDIITR